MKVAISHFDPQELLADLLVSPDIYDCRQTYEKIYDNCCGGMDTKELTELTDQIDVIYKLLMDKVNKLIRLKYAQESFKFHQWINSTTAIFGSVEDRPTHWTV